jgi:protein-disulfide isomerase
MTKGKSKDVKLTMPVSKSNDHIQGSADAPVILVEYGDFECPYTRQAFPIVKEIRARLGDTICFVFRNFPLNEIHPHAEHAAEAAEAAAAQNKFWQMHDHLFEHQEALDDHHLTVYALRIGLDTDRFKREMSEHIYAPALMESLKDGIKSGVEGTPTFFLNGVRYEGSWDSVTLLKRIKSSIKHR